MQYFVRSINQASNIDTNKYLYVMHLVRGLRGIHEARNWLYKCSLYGLYPCVRYPFCHATLCMYL